MYTVSHYFLMLEMVVWNGVQKEPSLQYKHLIMQVDSEVGERVQDDFSSISNLELSADTVELVERSSVTDVAESETVADLSSDSESCESPHLASPGLSHHEDNSDSPLCQRFDPLLYDRPDVAALLYEGSTMTVLEAVAHHMLWFTDHPGISKDALSVILHMQHHSILPQPNLLPFSCSGALGLIEPFLIKPLEFDVCPNDCVIFCGEHAALVRCPMCNSDRYKKKDIPFRRFRYLPVGPRLERLFGTASLAQLVQAHALPPTVSLMSDIHHSPMWNEAYSDGGVFNGDPRGIALGICADGVNPFSHLRTTYSMCPIVLSLLNLLRKIRHNFGNLLLVGIVPGNGRHEAKSIQPYLEILVDELLSLSKATVFDAYQQAEFKLNVEILLHILDYPGIGKLFNIAGSGAYSGCAWCDIRGTLAYFYFINNYCNKFLSAIYQEHTASPYQR